MGTRDLRIDAYIAKSADFAKPILRHIRETVHQVCPESGSRRRSEETRSRRLETAIEWMAEGKSRHWKYVK